MANYTLSWSNTTLKSDLTVTGATIDTSLTSLSLIGKGSINYGKFLQENMMHIMENFASGTAPLHPTAGQLWYNPTTGAGYTNGRLYLHDGAAWQQVYPDTLTAASVTSLSGTVSTLSGTVSTLSGTVNDIMARPHVRTSGHSSILQGNGIVTNPDGLISTSGNLDGSSTAGIYNSGTGVYVTTVAGWWQMDAVIKVFNPNSSTYAYGGIQKNPYSAGPMIVSCQQSTIGNTTLTISASFPAAVNDQFAILASASYVDGVTSTLQVNNVSFTYTGP